MRVAIISHNAQTGDAIGNQVAEKLSFFLECGAEVRVFVETIRRLHPAIRPHVCCLAEPTPTGKAWDFLRSADLIIVEYGQAYALLRLLPLLAGGKARILFDYHGITPAEFCDGHNRERIDEGARQCGLVWCADAAIVHSRLMSEELHNHTAFPLAWTQTFEHPIDLQRFSPGAPARDLRGDLRIGDAPIALYVGRLAANKRVPLLIEALSLLRDSAPELHLVIVGDTSDVYQKEAQRCTRLATDLYVANRVHILGHLDDARLIDAYRSADVFVMPSAHEGFCIPVIEAMACGVPVVAARATALPETVGSAGLTFEPDEAVDLARQVRRVLEPRRQKTEDRGQRTEDRAEKTADSPLTTHHSPLTTHHSPLRIAVVAFRYGTDFVGGVERSLRTVAEALTENGHHVEVFTTCTKSESDWADELPEGTVEMHGIPVHRFRLDPHDRKPHYEVVRTILERDGRVSKDTEQEYLAHSVHSTRLLSSLGSQADKFDAIIVGPYLFGLTYDVARTHPEKSILVPCFHNEPFARLHLWRPVYERVASIWYHSPEEQRLAETELGFNHPYARCMATVLDVDTSGDAIRGHTRVGTDGRYLVYCGRYSRQKNLPLVIDYARRYHKRHPDRFSFAFLGHGEVPIPKENWACDLGFVDERAKRDMLAGAAGLLQLSLYESLSFAALEAWAQGIPIIAHEKCAVLAGQIQRAGGGKTIDTFESFVATLDDLWINPQRWREMGMRGQTYTRATYGCRATFAHDLANGIHALKTPLLDQLRRRGVERAAELDRTKWRQRFSDRVEELLHAPRRDFRAEIEIVPRTTERAASNLAGTILVPVRIVNRGTLPLANEGPGRSAIRCQVIGSEAHASDPGAIDTDLPGVVIPDREIAMAVRVGVPRTTGQFQVSFRIVSLMEDDGESEPANPIDADASMKLIVTEGQPNDERAYCTPVLDAARSAIAEAERNRHLPDDYLDVTEGRFAKWKRWIKRKLLGNFKHAYVDVLSRKQSNFNRNILSAVQELAECLAVLDHARSTGNPASEEKELGVLAERIQSTIESGKADELGMLIHALCRQLAESRRAQEVLKERLTALEQRILTVTTNLISPIVDEES
jgi:glycosyltransferase involved in cell wall biosynthesis